MSCLVHARTCEGDAGAGGGAGDQRGVGEVPAGVHLLTTP